MIQGINNAKYGFYQVGKKELEISKSAVETPRVKRNDKTNNEALYNPCTYNQYEIFEESDKSKWEEFVEEIDSKDEAYGLAMKEGYTLENKEWRYLDDLNDHQNMKGAVQKQSNKNLSEKIDRIKERHDSMYYYGVAHQGTITVNDLYKWSFGGEVKSNTTQYSKEQLSGVLGMNGLSETPGNLKAVDKLLSLGLDASQENVTKIQNMETAVDGLEKYEESQEVIEENTPLMEDEKILYKDKDIQEIVDELSQVDDETIGKVLGEGKEVTIGNLREVLHRNTEKALGNPVEKSTENPTENPTDLKDPKTPEKIEDIKDKVKDIRAKLNVEAAQKISEKMPLESTELSKVAKELTAVHEEKIVAVLESVEATVTPENKEMLSQTMEAVVMMGRQKALAIELQVTDEDVTLEQVGQVAKAYEEQALEPEKRFGETLAKVEDQIEAFLKEENIEPTKEVIEAAKALIVNKVPLTAENLENAVAVVKQMNVFLEEMTPYRAATLIKEGLNPYKASVGHLMEWIAAERLPEMSDTLSEAILSLDEKGKINDHQKQSMIGLYRILQGVQQHKFEVAGYLYKNQMPMTIEKLQEAVQYSGKTEHIKVAIDDQFGELEKVDYSGKTARIMLAEAKEEQDEIINYVKILENLEIPFESEKDIKDYSKVSQKIYPFIKQFLKEHMDKFEGIDVLPDSFKEKLQTLKQLEPEVIKTMEKHQIPLTLSNMHWMQKMAKEPDLYQKILQKHELGEKPFPKSFEEIEKFVDEELRRAESSKSQAMASGDMMGYRTYKQLEEVIGLQKQLMNQEGLYHIPFMVDGQSKMVQLYIKENNHKKAEKEDSLKVAISYDTKHLGQVSAYLDIKDKEITYEVFGQNDEATKQLRSEGDKLTQMIKKIGFVLLEGHYIQDAKRPTVVEPMPKRSNSQFEVSV